MPSQQLTLPQLHAVAPVSPIATQLLRCNTELEVSPDIRYGRARGTWATCTLAIASCGHT